MSNASPQHELVGLLVNTYPHLVLRLAEVTGMPYPAHQRVAAGPNDHQIRKGGGKRGQLHTDASVHLLEGETRKHFFQVEMQRDYVESKVATLRAYHGSEVRNSGCGGQVFVVSPDAGTTRSFRQKEDEVRARYAFSVSYLSSQDLRPLATAGRPFEERALAAAVTGCSAGFGAATVSMLAEMKARNETAADLYLQAMLMECPDEVERNMTKAVLDIMDTLPSFQRWAARANADLIKELAEARAETAQAQAQADKAQAQADKAQAQGIARSLLDYFVARNDVPTPAALKKIEACASPPDAQHWLRSAYAGKTAAEIFPEPAEEPEEKA